MPAPACHLSPCLALSLIALAPVPGAAAAATINGKLSRGGYTVIAMSANGKARSARATPRFSVRAPAGEVSLHLRRPDGVYAGPIVVATQRGGKRVVVGIRAGARLGTIAVSARRGYARAQGVAARWREPALWARAVGGVPRGNGSNFGRVRQRPGRAKVPGDADLDGIPNRLDVDNDGDLVLDPVDRRPGHHARAAQADPGAFHMAVVFAPPFEAGVNANAQALTDADIDAALAGFGYLILGMLPDSPELDCGGQADAAGGTGWTGGLSYCTRGGSGLVSGGPSTGQAFPGGPGGPFDADGDGFGTPVNNGGPPPGYFFLDHRATTAQIGTGDVLIQRSAGGEATVLLPFVFATQPALVAYSDGAGNSATVEYPMAQAGPVPTQPPPGTMGNPFPVRARANGDVLVELTLWRPQRRPIGAEVGDWIDVGGLGYTAKTHFTPDPSCPQNAFSEDDANLDPTGFALPTGPAGLVDHAADQPASPANSLTLTLNLTRCRAAHGQSLAPGQTVTVSFTAVTVETGTQDGTRGQTDLAVSFRREA